MGQRCTQTRFLEGKPQKLRSTTKSKLCGACVREGYTIEDAPIVDSDESTANGPPTEKPDKCRKCGERPAAVRFKTKPNADLKPDEVLLNSDIPPDDVPLCEECGRDLVNEFQEHGVIVYSPPSNLRTCDCCLYLAEDILTQEGDRLCATCRAVFGTAKVLLTGDVTDEAELIPTLAFVAYRARRAQPSSEQFARKYTNFEFTRTMDDVPLLRLKPVIMEVIKYPDSTLAKLIRIRVISKFAKPDTIEELYREVLQREGLPVSGTRPGNIFSDYKDAHLIITAAPLEEIPPIRVPHLAKYPFVHRFSFPLPSVLKAVCQALIGSPKRPGTKGDEMFARGLGDHDRPTPKTAKTTIPACVAWIIGEHDKSIKPAIRRRRIAKMLNQHLFKPLGKSMVADNPWDSGDPVWNDANEVGPRFDLARLFFQIQEENDS
jgi:hypothetical protein